MFILYFLRICFIIYIDLENVAKKKEMSENIGKNRGETVPLQRTGGIGKMMNVHDASWRRQVESEMDDALKNGEFKVYLQPKMNMVTAKLYGAEALSRWEKPGEGLRRPDSYIPVFEENGFVAKLDMFMYEEVCKLKKSWEGKPYAHIPISVNMSRIHLRNRGFSAQVRAIVDKYEIPPEEIDLEVTESVFVDDSGILIEMMNELKAQGFRLSIDDFGAGYSALNLLKDLPSDTIKIDKEFLDGGADSKKGKIVLKNIISMCLDLKQDVVTEGIETREQAEFISKCGCQIAQGYYYSRPLCIEDFMVYAEKSMIHMLGSYKFRLNGDLESEDGSMEGMISGDGLEYRQGIFKDSLAMHFPGGATEMNTVHIPPTSIVNDSFAVGVWLKPETLRDWVSALYIKFESGFCTIVPRMDEGLSDMRIRDSREVNGWYDISGPILEKNVWTYYFINYDAKKEIATSYINGKMVGRMEGVPTNRYVKWIILGGDVFQPSFEGSICELTVFNESKTEEFVAELYESYVTHPDFTGNQS